MFSILLRFATAPLGFVVSFLVLVGPSISCHRHEVSLPITNLHVPFTFNKSIHFKKPGWHPRFSSNLQSNSWPAPPLKLKRSIPRCFGYFCNICLTLSYHIYIYYHPFFPQQPIFVCACGVSLPSSRPNCIEGAFLELRLVGPRVVLWAMARGWQNLEESHAIHCGLFSSKKISCGKPNAIKKNNYNLEMNFCTNRLKEIVGGGMGWLRALGLPHCIKPCQFQLFFVMNPCSAMYPKQAQLIGFPSSSFGSFGHWPQISCLMGIGRKMGKACPTASGDNICSTVPYKIQILFFLYSIQTLVAV